MTYDERVAPRREERPHAPPRLFVIGDSISLHYGDYLEALVAGRFSYARKRAEPGLAAGPDAWLPDTSGAAASVECPAARRDALDYPLGPFDENAGDSGMVLAYLGRLPAAVAEADVILLNCGLHDLKVSRVDGNHQVPLESYRANLVRIVELLGVQHKRWAWCSTTPVDDATHARHGAELAFTRCQADVLRYNDVAGSVMEAAGVPTFDLHAATLQLAHGGALADLYCDHVHFVQRVRLAQAALISGWLESNFASPQG